MKQTRREFVKAGVAAAACAALPMEAVMAKRVGSAKRNLRKALKFGMIGVSGDVSVKFAAAKAAGFAGVEMDSPNDLPLEEVLAAKRETGLEIPGVVDSVHWHHTLGDPDAGVREKGRVALETAIRDCHAYGGGSVLLVPAVVNASISYADAYARSQEEIRKVIPLARELGIRISIENVWNNFLLSPLEAARYTDEIDPEVMGWHFDIGNIVNYGWPEQWIRTLGHRITRLDVKEFSRRKRNDEGLWKGFEVEIGEGDCGWPAVMAALDEIGYSTRPEGAWAAAEVGGGDVVRLKEIAERMERAFGG